MYLVDIAPKNLQKGKITKLFFRDSGKSKVMEVEIPHLIPSRKDSVGETKRKVEQLQKTFPSLTFEIKEYNGKATIWAYGPREMKEKLPGYFQKDESSVVGMLRIQTNFPFSIVGERDKKLFFGESVATEALLEEKSAALDIETEKWGTADEKIFMASFYTDSNFGNWILTTYPVGEEKISINGEEAKVEAVEANVIECKDEKEISTKLTELFHSYDPLFVYGSNIGDFDLLRLKRSGQFLPGADRSEPKIEARGGFYPRVIIKGRYVLDSAPFSLNWLWLPRNDLPTVASYLLDEKVEKGLSYEEIEKLLEMRSTEAVEQIAIYNLRDAMYSFRVGKTILRIILDLSKMFRTSPSTICTTSKKNIASDLHDNEYFAKFNTLRKKGFDFYIKKDGKKEVFDIKKIEHELINEKIKKLSENLAHHVHVGLFRDVSVVYLTPFVKGYRAISPKVSDEIASVLYNQKYGTKEKIIAVEALNAYLTEPLWSAYNLTKLRYVHSPFEIPEGRDKFFGYFYGIFSSFIHHSGEVRSANIQTFVNAIDDAIVEIAKKLAKAELINYSDKFVFFRNEAVANELEEKGLGILLGIGNALSIGDGRVVFEIDGRVLAQNIDPKGRRGNRTLFESELIERLSSALLLHSKRDALEVIHSAMQNFWGGSVEREKLVYLTKEVKIYSARALAQERIAAAIAHGTKAGENFGYGYGSVRSHVGRYAPGHTGIIKTPEFFDKNVEIEKPMYIQKWFCRDGTVGKFIDAVWQKKEEREVVNKIAEGKEVNEEEISKLVTEQLELF